MRHWKSRLRRRGQPRPPEAAPEPDGAQGQPRAIGQPRRSHCGGAASPRRLADWNVEASGERGCGGGLFAPTKAVPPCAELSRLGVTHSQMPFNRSSLLRRPNSLPARSEPSRLGAGDLRANRLPPRSEPSRLDAGDLRAKMLPPRSEQSRLCAGDANGDVTHCHSDVADPLRGSGLMLFSSSPTTVLLRVSIFSSFCFRGLNSCSKNVLSPTWSGCHRTTRGHEKHALSPEQFEG